jgi:hypothetical protein
MLILDLVNHVTSRPLLQTDVGTQPLDSMVLCLLALSTDATSPRSAIREVGYDTRSTFEELGVALESSEDNHDQLAEKGMGDDPKLPDDSPDTYLGKAIQITTKTPISSPYHSQGTNVDRAVPCTISVMQSPHRTRCRKAPAILCTSHIKWNTCAQKEP